MTHRFLGASILASCLGLAGGAAAQQYNKKDLGKAEELAAKDKTFKELSPEEREEAVQKIAEKIHGNRRRATKADIVTLDGKTLEELEAKRKARYKRYELVSSEETKGTEQDPPRTELVTNSVGTAPFGRLFQDNEWSVVEGSQDAEALRKQVDEILEKAKATGGRIVSMHVESSASTLRNTGQAAAMTHAALSRARAEAAALRQSPFDRPRPGGPFQRAGDHGFLGRQRKRNLRTVEPLSLPGRDRQEVLSRRERPRARPRLRGPGGPGRLLRPV